jgi:AcrR family transcriptional regulator
MAERRQRILAAARGIIAERGFDALTMRSLARASRVTVPTVYNLIGGKDAVLVAAVEEQTARFLAGIERRPERQPAERLLAVVDACVEELLRLPAYYRTLLPLLSGSAAAAEARARVDRALGAELGKAVAALDAGDGLAAWVEPDALLESLRAHLGARALRWAAGALGDAAFRADARYEACLTLLGVTRGRDRAVFAREARAAQSRRRAVRGEREAARSDCPAEPRTRRVPA